MNEKITIADIAELVEFGSSVRVVSARTGKTIIDGLGALKNSKDKRQIAKWEAYRDVVISNMRLIASDMSLDNAVLFAKAWMEANYRDEVTSLEIRRQAINRGDANEKEDSDAE